jgi:hypothetical protein
MQKLQANFNVQLDLPQKEISIPFLGFYRTQSDENTGFTAPFENTGITAPIENTGFTAQLKIQDSLPN